MNGTRVSRRDFLGTSLAAVSWLGALGAEAAESVAAAGAPEAGPITRKIKIGVVGLGGRGNWITGHFRAHGGYVIHAVADYFPHVAVERGKGLGVPEARCFSGLSGYRKVIESGVEALVIEDVPYFYPEQARDAVDAGLHVYMAKPVAVDAPGVRSVGESGKRATAKQRVFLVDYQMPNDPHNMEVMRRLGAGAVGVIQTIFSTGAAGGAGFADKPRTATIESRLQNLVWVNDDALGCGYIGNYDIHVVDAVLRAVGRTPVSAVGWGDRCLPARHGDAMDTTCVMYMFKDGLVWNHQSVRGTSDDWFSANGSLAAAFQGAEASARLSYWGKAHVRGGQQHYGGGKVENLYEDGARRNVAVFYEAVTKNDCTNPTVKYAVDSALVSILGREAAARRTTVTMDQLLKENRKLEVDLKGLKA